MPLPCNYYARVRVTIISIYACIGDDIDECSTGPNNCDQVCANTEGSFTCACEAGYVQDTDGASCSGIPMTM